MSVMLMYERFEKLFGIRRLGGLENPKVRPLARLALPRGSVYHYMPLTETELGPGTDSPVIQAAQRLVFIDHVSDLLVKEGNPRPTYRLIGPMQQEYRRQNMMVRPMRDYDQATKELTNMVVVNYAMVGHMYKYQRSALSRWWNWKNLRSTMWEKFNQLKTQNERHHLIVMDLPATLPALSDLRKAERGMTPMLMKVFSTRERLDLLDIWCWLGDQRSRTPMARLDESRLSEIDLVIRREAGVITINLGLLNSWRKEGAGVSMEALTSTEPEVVFDFDLEFARYLSMESLGDDSLDDDMYPSMENANGLDPKVIQVRFLRMLSRVIEQTNPAVGGAQDNGDFDEPSEDQSEIDKQTEKADADQDEAVLAATGADELLVEEEEDLSEELDEPGDAPGDIEITDEDGELIIETNQTAPAESSVQAVSSNLVEHTLTSNIQEKIDELTDKDLMTAGQYRRMQRLAASYQTMANPWDKTVTIGDSLEVKEEDLIIAEAETYPDMESVRDKSMLQSTVEKMDSQYIEKVMKKDILNSVMSMQRAGIAVTGYDIEVVKDAVSHYEVHRVQLTPVTGKPSTITFRVPVVDKRGVYTSNGQRYRMRTQKSDKQYSNNRMN